MMLRLAEGLRLPLGPDDFADYARAMEGRAVLGRARENALDTRRPQKVGKEPASR